MIMTAPYFPRLDLLLLGTDEFGSALGVTMEFDKISMLGVVDTADKIFPRPSCVVLREDMIVGAAFDLARGQPCRLGVAILSMHPTQALPAGEP